MLVERFREKTGKKKQPETFMDSEDNLESFQSWIRKLEQSTLSLSSRLAAIERRISGRPSDTSSILSQDTMQGPIQRIFADLKDAKKKKTVEETAHILDTEFSFMQEELVKQRDDLESMKEQLGSITTSLQEIKDQLVELHTTNMQLVGDTTTRLDRIERREPPTLKLAGKEIPIEITGLIGGIIMFFIALIVIIGQKDIIISPIFLSIIGIILIASTIIKTLKLSATPLKSLKKTEPIARQIDDTR
jgi:hypothetical protein